MNNFSVKTAANLLIITICLTGLYLMNSVLMPLMMALLIAILLQPIISFFQRKLKLGLTLAISLAILLTLLLGAVIIIYIAQEVSGFADDALQIQQHVSTHIHTIQNWIADRFHISYYKQKDYLLNLSSQALAAGQKLAGSTLSGFSSILINALLIPIYTFLILLYKKLFINFLKKLVPNENHHIVFEILLKIKTVVHDYILGLLLNMLLVALATSLCLMALGVKYAVFLGIVTAILNLIPYVGIIISTLLSMIVALGSSPELSVLLSVLIVFTVIYFINSNLVVPKMISPKIKINAFISMVVVIGGGALMGLSGMFLAMPIAAIVKVIFDRIPELKPWGYLLGDDVN